MNEEKFEKGILSVPKEISDEINMRCIRAHRVNTMYAVKLHPDGGEYAISNSLDNSISAWLLYQMKANDASPREAIEGLMELVVECLLPNFINIPEVTLAAKKEVAKQEASGESSVLSQVNELLRNHDMEPIVVGGTLDEIIEQLTGLRDADGETLQ